MRGLRYHRIINDMTQSQVAHYLKIGSSHYAKIERGEVQPKLVHLVKMAKLFECSIDDLV